MARGRYTLVWQTESGDTAIITFDQEPTNFEVLGDQPEKAYLIDRQGGIFGKGARIVKEYYKGRGRGT